jgi:hypothetical protein
MKHFIYFVVLLAASAGIVDAAEQELRKCDFEVKAHCVTGDATVTLADGAVKRLEVNVLWCGQRGSPGYTCTIDSSRGDQDSKWSDEGGATVIDNTAPFTPTLPDRVKVTVGKFVSIDFEEAQSLGRCGAGAELPRAIVIPQQKAACRVFLGAP